MIASTDHCSYNYPFRVTEKWQATGKERTTVKITTIETDLYRVPLDQPLGDAIHGTHTHFELIISRVRVEDGTEGVGYTYTGGFGGRAIREMIRTDLTPFLIGQDASRINYLWNAMNWRVHYVGKGGLASFALAALDVALWDLRGKKTQTPLWKLAGGANTRARAYGGGIDLQFTTEQLVRNVKGYLDAGLRGVKIKVGRDRLDEDVERVAAVRKAIGRDVDFMVDANMKWPVETAIRATHKLREFDLLWLEEPTIPDDIRGYREIASRGALPLAAGENYHTVMEFKNMFEFGRVDFPQPDVSTVGGITAWLKVADLAFAHNLPVCCHGMQELHVSLMAGVPHAGYLEVHSFPIDRYTARPLVIDADGWAVAPDTPGNGVEFRMDLLGRYKVDG